MAIMGGLLCVFSSFPSKLVSYALPAASGGSVVIRLLLLVFCGAAVALALRERPQPRQLLSTAPLLWALVALAFLSASWSALPGLSLRRAGALLAVVLFGYALQRRLSLLQLLRLVAWSMGALLLLSLLAVLVEPEMAIHPRGGWRGVMHHRNHLGMVAVLELLALGMLAAWGEGRERQVARFLLPVAALWLVAVNSVTAVVLVLGAGAVLLAAVLSERRPAWRGPLLAVLAVIPWIVFWQRSALLELVGRRADLTGRLGIWRHISEAVMEQPVLGYGYGLSWRMAPSLQADLVEHGHHWQAHIHSGYLSTGFWLGLLGLALLLLWLLRLGWLAMVEFRTGEGGLERALPLTLLVVLLLAAFPEDRMLAWADTHMALLAFLAFHLGSEGKRPMQASGESG